MRVLVTGGAGFIGSAVCRHLVRECGAHVLNIDALTYAANLESLAPVAGHRRHSFAKVDICSRGAIEAIFSRFRPTAVMHLAAESHVDRSINDAAAFIKTNVEGTFTLLDVARKYYERLTTSEKTGFRFLHVSTDEVYGSLGDTGLFTEDTPYQPRSPYSASKAASDHLALAWHHTFGLPVLVTNCSNNYGPYQFPEKLIPLMVLNALEGKALPVYGKGANIRDWIFVDDHVRGLVAALKHGRPGEKYNFGGNAERTNLAVVEAICDALDELSPMDRPRRSLINFVADRPGHDFRYAIDFEKSRRELAWSPGETFESGLRSTVQWYLSNQSWWQPLRDGVYDGRRLGLLTAAE